MTHLMNWWHKDNQYVSIYKHICNYHSRLPISQETVHHFSLESHQDQKLNWWIPLTLKMSQIMMEQSLEQSLVLTTTTPTWLALLAKDVLGLTIIAQNAIQIQFQFPHSRYIFIYFGNFFININIYYQSWYLNNVHLILWGMKS